MSGSSLLADQRRRHQKDYARVATDSGKLPDNTLAARVPDIVMTVVITICCLAIEIYAPVQWQPDLIWLMLAPGCGLIFGAMPAMLLRRRHHNMKKKVEEQQELVGLLLKDYAAERSDWLWSCDENGKLHGVSDKFAAQTGQNAIKLEGFNLLEFLRDRLPAESVALMSIELAMRQRKPFFDIETPVRIGQESVWWRLAGKPVFRDERFSGYVGTASDITAEIMSKERISFLAHHDSLTGLANRARFTDRLNECVARLERYGTAFSVLYLDLDKFKSVNDSRGHQAGDRLLVEVGNRLRSLLRDTDLVARLGGDEFSVILPDTSDGPTVADLAARLIDEVKRPYEIDGDSLTIGLCVGVAIAPANGTRPDQILRNSDLALYRAKADGGNRYCFFESRMDAEIRERRILELELADALERDEFVLHYQPLISVADGTVAGYEALIRWNHPIRGLLSPVEFIPIAEQSALIGRIGEWTIAEACRMLTHLPERMSIAVNLSAKHFRLDDMSVIVKEALSTSGVAAYRLELEITESLLIDNPDEMAQELKKLKSLGVTIAMDDFGTGFSSLSYLLKFPFDKIKIDRSFVAASSEDGVAKQILCTIVGLAKTLEIAITAEGVETEEQAEFLRETGCDLLQGFLFSKPLAEAGIAALNGRAWSAAGHGDENADNSPEVGTAVA